MATKIREEFRQWLLLLIGGAGTIYESFFSHPFDGAKFAIYLGLLGFSRADFALALFERLSARADTPWLKAQLKDGLERTPTIATDFREQDRKDETHDDDQTDQDVDPRNRRATLAERRRSHLFREEDH